jgi:hypothetical protein
MEHVTAAVLFIIIVALIIASRPGKCKRCGGRKERVYNPGNIGYNVDCCPDCDEKDLNELYTL